MTLPPRRAAAAAPALPYRPYLSALLGKAAGRLRNAAAANRLAQLTAAALPQIGAAPGGVGPRVATVPGPATRHGGLWVTTLTYRQTSTPAWAVAVPGTAAPQDVAEHLVVIAAKGARTAICGSDTAIYGALQRAIPPDFDLLTHAEMEAAFVGSEAKAIWMSGVHARTAVKPSAKTLMGEALEYALDPLGDQTFYFSAMRSRVTYPVAGRTTDKVVGVAPGQSRVWVGRPADWAAFIAELEAVMDHAAAPGSPRSELFDALARTVPFTGVGAPGGVGVAPPDLLSEAEVDPAIREMAVRWAYEVRLACVATGPLSLTITATWQGHDLGDLAVEITPGADRHDIQGRWLTTPRHATPAIAAEQDALREAALDLVLGKDWLRIHFQTGEVLAGRRLFRPQFRDALFAYTPRNFAGYDVDREKPAHTKAHPLVRAIAGLDSNGNPDTSLFAWVVERMFLDAAGRPYGWLASDDGSMEFADFVHIDAVADIVTLVHVKAADSSVAGRNVTLPPFEVVVAQAIKNLRHLDHVHLHEALHRGQNKKIARAVWRDGVRQPNRAGIIRAARALPQGYARRLVVLQPQLTEAERIRCETGGATPQRRDTKRRLDTLLNGARLAARAVEADLEVCTAV